MTTAPAFYVGWAALAPARLAGWLRRVALGLLVAAPVLGAALGALGQDRAGPGFGGAPILPQLPQEARLEGVLVAGPYPLLHVPGTPARTLLLAQDGKRGAPPGTAALDGRMVRAEGYTMWRGTIEMLVLSAAPVALPGEAPAVPRVPLGRWEAVGEICDGKCAAGAMRPGNGIGHRACATLCLDGGLPAVFVPAAPLMGHGFLVLGDAAGGPALPAFRDAVGRQVTLRGRVERVGSLAVLLADAP